jgi:hypothetical protein
MTCNLTLLQVVLLVNLQPSFSLVRFPHFLDGAHGELVFVYDLQLGLVTGSLAGQFATVL